MPDDGALVDFIPRIAPTAQLQRQLLSRQPHAPLLEPLRSAQWINRTPPDGRCAQQRRENLMARITAGVTTSHVPAIGAALDNGKSRDAYWAPVFAGYDFSKRWIAAGRSPTS